MQYTTFNRRRFLRLVLGIPSLLGLPKISVLAQVSERRRIIDVHCHVFNGKDVPARPFIRTVVFSNYPPEVDVDARGIWDVGKKARDGAADLVIAMIEAGAPSVAAERDCIEQGRCSWIGALIDGRSADVRSLSDGPRFEEDMIKDYYRLKAGEPRTTYFKDDVWKSDIEKLDAVIREAGVPDPSERTLDTRSIGDAARRLSDPAFVFAAMLNWGRLLASYRRDIIKRYIETYDTTSYQTVLFAPALIDFTYWLAADQPKSLQPQIELMNLLARQQTGARMHGYVAYDPLHQVRVAGQTGPTPLDLAKTAVAEHGFLGVKLYSPMGFRPFGNADLHTWPQLVTPDRELGQHLDDAMLSLYEWASAEQVPIMAHTMNSQAANKDYGQRANPSLWHEPLRRYPDLRLNLAHFGNFVPMPESHGDVATSWEWSIGELIKDGYKNVFADLSYFSIMFGADYENGNEPVRIRECLKRWLREFDPQCDRLLYGTDWSMIARELNNANYPERMEKFLRSVGLDSEQLDKVFFKNAVRYFGLENNQPSRVRLERYYQRNGIAVSKLQVFD